jgi:hypothetical protein
MYPIYRTKIKKPGETSPSQVNKLICFQLEDGFAIRLSEQVSQFFISLLIRPLAEGER